MTIKLINDEFWDCGEFNRYSFGTGAYAVIPKQLIRKVHSNTGDIFDYGWHSQLVNFVQTKNLDINKTSLVWHQDGVRRNGYLGIWANKYPTNVRSRGVKEAIDIKKNRFYVWNNALYEHKSPAEVMDDQLRCLIHFYWEECPIK